MHTTSSPSVRHNTLTHYTTFASSVARNKKRSKNTQNTASSLSTDQSRVYTSIVYVDCRVNVSRKSQSRQSFRFSGWLQFKTQFHTQTHHTRHSPAIPPPNPHRHEYSRGRYRNLYLCAGQYILMMEPPHRTNTPKSDYRGRIVMDNSRVDLLNGTIRERTCGWMERTSSKFGNAIQQQHPKIKMKTK